MIQLPQTLSINTDDPKELKRLLMIMYDDIYSAFTQNSWVDVTSFSNSWVNFGSVYYGAGYCKDSFGFVYLRGMIKSGTVASDATGTAFTLPAGFRPSMTVVYSIMSNGAVGKVDIDNAGAVLMRSPTNNTYASLDGITFYAGAV